MLEAQFRDAGCKLNDLDLDAQDSLKAMDPPCREAAVKVLSITSVYLRPCPQRAVLIQTSQLMVSATLVSERAILHRSSLTRVFLSFYFSILHCSSLTRCLSHACFVCLNDDLVRSPD